MLYDGNNPILRVTDVAQLRYSFGSYTVGSREYAELVFLAGGSMTVTCGDRKHCARTGNMLYLPQNLAYTASYSDAEIIAIRFLTAVSDSVPEVYAL